MSSTQQHSGVDDDVLMIQYRKGLADKRQNITLFKSPLKTCQIFAIVAKDWIGLTIKYLFTEQRALLGVIFALISTLTILYFVPGSHQPFVEDIEELTLIGIWWLFLGILSSVGLGTGLHTFVLYLGPFIAKVTLAATECNSLDFATHGADSFICPIQPEDMGLGDPPLISILHKVQFEALMWGAGTAIGELPPYFVARAARLAGQRLEEIDELNEADSNASLMERISIKVKKMMLVALGNLGFVGIMLFASIPNPLFDLAGITCGWLNVSFWTFFGATLVGKAFIKSHIQTIFVITMFSKFLMTFWVTKAESFFPFLKGTIDDFFEKQKAQFHRSHNTADTTPTPKSLIAVAWDYFLIAMLLYFLVSIVNSSVQGYLAQKDEEELEKIKSKQKRQ